MDPKHNPSHHKCTGEESKERVEKNSDTTSSTHTPTDATYATDVDAADATIIMTMDRVPQAKATTIVPSERPPKLPPYQPYQIGLSREQAPSYMQYPNITGGYRTGGDYWTAMKSLFQWHTETMNAWTMLLTSAFSLAATFVVCATQRVQPQYAPVFAIFTLSTLTHLPFSVGCHLFMPISHKVFARWRKLDVCAIFSVSVPLVFALAFFILPWWGVYLATGVTAAVAAVAVPIFWSTPDELQLGPTKQALFVGTIICCWMSPMAVGFIQDCLAGQLSMGGGMFVGTFLSLFIGGYLYAVGIPEKWAPGRFDILGHSHQLMHVGVLTAQVCEFFFIYYSYKRYVSRL